MSAEAPPGFTSWKRKDANIWLKICIGLILLSLPAASARRRDVKLPAAPTRESLHELAELMGAAGFKSEADSSEKVLTKRLVPGNPDPDVDPDVEYQNYQGVMGRPGIDFPVFTSIPHTNFNCKNVATGYYADLETDCQVFHICDTGRKISFLCPNGTIFHQSHLICDWWFKVDCASSPEQYEESAEQLAEDQRKRDRANKDAKTSSRKVDPTPQINYDLDIHRGHNHNRQEYKAEASFTSEVKNPKSNPNPNRGTNSRSFQIIAIDDGDVSNARQFSSFESRSNEDLLKRKNLIKKTSERFATARPTMPHYTDAGVYRSSTPSYDPFQNKESQVLAETASFASSRNRQYYQQNADNYQQNANNYQQNANQSPKAQTPIPYQQTRDVKPTRPSYATTYVPGTRNYVEVSRSVTQSVTVKPRAINNNRDSNVNHFREQQTEQSTAINVVQTRPKPKTTSGNSVHKTANTYYAPTVPTVTPKGIGKIKINSYSAKYSSVQATSPTPELTTTNPTESSVVEHAAEMLETLEELELAAPKPTSDVEKYLGKRPGLIVPPSVGPKTLHSLAIYFASAVDNITATPPTANQTESFLLSAEEEERLSEENQEAFATLLTHKTIAKYGDLFKENSTSTETYGSLNDTFDLGNDLDSSQTRGSLASSPQIRELAQVFTHALSAYLQDPDTFRKVLSEIRPTDPPILDDASTTAAEVPEDLTTTDIASVTKEEDEVLDFSDVTKKRSRKKPGFSTTLITEVPTAFKLDTSTYTTTESIAENDAIIDLKGADLGNRFSNYISFTTSSPDSREVEIDAFALIKYNNSDVRAVTRNPPVFTTVPMYGGFQNNTERNYTPYGTGVKPLNATPISSAYPTSLADIEAIPLHWGDVITTHSPSTDLNPSAPAFDLVPPTALDNAKYTAVKSTVLTSFEPEDLNDLALKINSDVSAPGAEYDSQRMIPLVRERGQTKFNSQYRSSEEDSRVSSDNEEELQRAQSQSFVASQNQLNRKNKKIVQQNKKNTVGKDDKEMPEINNSTARLRTTNGHLIPLPTLKEFVTTTVRPQETTEITFTTDYSDDTTDTTTDYTTLETITESDVSTTVKNNKWSTSAVLGQMWQTTVFLDPLTINEGLSNRFSPSNNVIDLSQGQTASWDSGTTNLETIATTTDITPVPTTISARKFTSFFSPTTRAFSLNSRPTAQSGRDGKSLFSASPRTVVQRLMAPEVDETIVEKAQEMFGSLNDTSASKLMNVMKQAEKNTTVRRLILLLVQTCDDDHTRTAEASRAALLDALMRLPQNTREPITETVYTTTPATTTTEYLTTTETPTDYTTETDTQESTTKTFTTVFDPTTTNRRMDSEEEEEDKLNPENEDLTGVSFVERVAKSFSPSSFTITTQAPTTFETTTFPSTVTETTTNSASTTTITTTKSPKRRGQVKKFLIRPSRLSDNPQNTSTEVKRSITPLTVGQPSDTRALELLRSLYTLAARWG